MVCFRCKNRVITHWQSDHPMPRRSRDPSHLKLVYSTPIEASNKAVEARSVEDEVAAWGVEYEVDPAGDLMQEIVLEWLLPATEQSRERDRLEALGLVTPDRVEYVTILPSAARRFWPNSKKQG